MASIYFPCCYVMRADAGMLLYGMSYALSPIDIKYKE